MDWQIRKISGQELVSEGEAVLVAGNLALEPWAVEKLKGIDLLAPEARVFGEELVGEYSGIELVVMKLVAQRVQIMALGQMEVWLRGVDKNGRVVMGEGGKVKVLSGDVADGQQLVVKDSGGKVEVTVQILNSKISNQSISRQRGGQANAKLPNVFASMTGWVHKLAPQKTGGTVYLGKGEVRDKTRKWTRVGGVAFVVLVGLLVVLAQVRVQKENARKAEVEKKIVEVTTNFSEAKNLAELDPVKSNQLLTIVEDGLKSLEKNEDQRLHEVRKEFGSVLGIATGAVEANMQMVLDLALVREDAIVDKLVWNGSKLVMLDAKAERIIEVDPVKKSGNVTLGKTSIGGARLVATYPGKIVVVNDAGVTQCVDVGEKCVEIIKKDDKWGEIVAMSVYANNVYLLDKGQNQIWRYLVTETGYGERQAWLQGDVVLEGDVKDMVIDGSVWVLGEGEIAKYVRGVKDNFVITGLRKGLGKELVVFVPEEGERLYVGDKQNARVVVLKKTGEYVGLYQDERFTKMVGLVVDEKNKKGYTVIDNDVWEMGF